MSETPSVRCIRADEGTPISAFGSTLLFKLMGPDTNEKLVIALSQTAPGEGPPPHIHRNEDELFIVIKGTYEFYSPSETFRAQPGDLVFAPKDSVHTFRNPGQELNAAWVLNFPAGFDRFYTALGQEFATGAPPRMEKIGEICASHGIEFAK